MGFALTKLSIGESLDEISATEPTFANAPICDHGGISTDNILIVRDRTL